MTAFPDLLSHIGARFSGRSVAVIGDLVADQYLNGSIARVSREAPVFILRHDQTTTLPGAAANAAANIASLGGRAILVGAIGDDANGRKLVDAIKERGVSPESIVTAPGATTTTKVRVLAGQPHAVRQQVIRIDYEANGEMSAETKALLVTNAIAACETADAVVISDYNYGVATPELFAQIKRVANERQIPLIVDSRFRLESFAGATSATPNQEEVEQIAGIGFTADDCSALCKRLDLDSLLVTNGSKGMQLFRHGQPPISIAAVGSMQPVDVTGAGDTVIAAYALGLASGLDCFDAAKVSNVAGGLVVMKKGTAVVTADELSAALSALPELLASAK